MDKFLIVTNRDKDKDLQVTGLIRKYLEDRGARCRLARPIQGNDALVTGYADALSMKNDIECVLVLGGDGTLLQTVRDFVGLDIPFAGINLGTTGFLAAIDRDELMSGLDALLQDRFTIQKRMLLKGQVFRGDKKLQETIAFNDVIVTRSGYSRLVELKIFVDGHLLDIYAADGVIVSTPTGSTGYNLSAGGPVVFPETEMLIITPICPHSLSARSVVVPAGARVVVEVGKRRKTQKEEAMVTYDGQIVWNLETGDRVQVERSPVYVPMIRIRENDFCDVLRNKLKNVQ